MLRGRMRWINLPLFVVIVALVSRSNDPHAVWSPYYYTTVHLLEQSALVGEREP